MASMLKRLKHRNKHLALDESVISGLVLEQFEQQQPEPRNATFDSGVELTIYGIKAAGGFVLYAFRGLDIDWKQAEPIVMVVIYDNKTFKTLWHKDAEKGEVDALNAEVKAFCERPTLN